MCNTRPDHETVRRAIAMAIRAPSVHNTQPWRWLIGDNSVHLMADWTRQVPATDPDGRDLLISCGAALHHLRVALAALGWASTVHRVPNPNDPTHVAAVELRPHATSEEDIAMAAAIPHRRTDRRRFSSWPVPRGHLDLLLERAAREGVLAVPVTDPADRHRLALAIAQAAARQESDPAYAAELSMWSGRSRGTQDGVMAASAPARHDDYGDTRMRAFRAGTLAQSTSDTEDAAELMVLATSGDDLLSRLRAGEAASAALLTATDLGLATCPLSQPLEIADTRHAIRDRILAGTAIPQLILRIGWAPTSAEPVPQSPRRHPEEITAFLPGMAPHRNGT